MKSKFNFLSTILLLIIAFNINGCGGNSDSADLVNAVVLEAQLNDGSLVTKLEIKNSGTRIRVGETFQMIALGTDLNDNVKDVSHLVTWQSAEPNYATINSTGLVTAISHKTDNQGLVTITATTLSDLSATGTISINNSDVSSIQVIQTFPDNNAIYTCLDTQFEAKVTYVDNLTHNTNQANWQLSGSSTANINSNGLLNTTAAAPESLLIMAELYGVSGQASVLTDVSQLNTIFIYNKTTQINSLSLQVGERLKLTSTASFNAGVAINTTDSTTDITHNTNWQSNNVEKLGITNNGENKGVLLALKAGNTLIEAQCSGVTNFVTVEMKGNDEITQFVINTGENELSLSQGQSINLQLLATYNNESNAINITEFVEWSIENTNLVNSQMLKLGTDETLFQIISKAEETGEVIVKATFDNQSTFVVIKIIN